MENGFPNHERDISKPYVQKSKNEQKHGIGSVYHLLYTI
jgi:hypothetical protein